jgi:hypothetical protein
MSEERSSRSRQQASRTPGEDLLARWWETVPHGWLLCLRCACGSLIEPVFEEDLEALGGFATIEARALKRFEEEHPACAHITALRKWLEDKAFEDAAEYMSRLEDELNALWTG